MIHKERVRLLAGRAVAKGDFVLCWMQASQREACNHALEFAVEQANGLGLPVLVYFGLTPRYPEANLRHYAFRLDGLAEVRPALAERGIGLVVRNESPELGAVRMSCRAALLVVDRGYMRHERAWRAAASRRASCPVYQVEANVIVPVEEDSNKEEYSAATFRPKVRRLLSRYLVPLKRRPVRKKYLAWDFETLDLAHPSRILARLPIRRSVGQTPLFLGGESQAGNWLEAFARGPIFRCAEKRSDPATDLGSRMSPDLHFGQVSPLVIALRAKKTAGPGPEAHRLAPHLNNKYELDGLDPNGTAGVGWCFGKHDRPWPPQPGFAKVRSMKSSGLERKYDMAGYIDRVEKACDAAMRPARTPSPGG